MLRDSFIQLAAATLCAALLFPGAADARPKRNATGASAPPSNQQETLVDGYNRNSAGSDDSLRNSTVYAMQALMDLANTKLVGAVKNGYNAYGKYRNSENLDRLKDEDALRANLLGSIGSAPVLPTGKTDTSFRRLDPSFLKEGDAGRVAAEFERQTGMKRETFLTEMANVSEQKIKRSDPMMIDKALSRFESFLHKIPNAEFRKNAEKGIAMVPDTMRRGMVAKAVQSLAGMFASAAPSGPGLDSTITDLAKGKLAGGAPSGATGASPSGAAVTGVGDVDPSKTAAAAGEANRDPATLTGATGAGSKTTSSVTGSSRDGFDGVVAAAILESRGQDSANPSGESTIFQQVTKRYRILTPGLTKASN